jgi:hypothetical protein
MTLPTPSADRVLNIYLALNQYPILSSRIRARMRRELFRRGIISPEAFEAESRRKAILSQEREGVHDPFAEEAPEIWEVRLGRLRDSLTDFYFAYNLPYELFEDLVREILAERGEDVADLVTFNPELAPHDMLFEQAEAIERMPTEERRRLEARLQEIKVVLIRTMVSDQLAYINIAKQWFTVADLREIRQRKIGQGKVGGKAAGMLLAARILNEVAPPEVRDCIHTPTSYYLGSDVMYSFMSINGLMQWADQKYKPEEQIRAEHPEIVQQFVEGRFPEDVLEALRELLEQAGSQPLIVRSSSLLEDNFGTSFAGKYDSIFCPNQGTPQENLSALTEAIARVYASGLGPAPLVYRHQKGLVDYDERIAVLIQFVQGERFGSYYLPHGSGVAFSRNLYRWSPQIKKEDGFVRLVWGLGTRAVEETGNDYPRLVALSHPLLYPVAEAKSIRRYAQQYVDLIDLEKEAFRTLPASRVMDSRYPPVRYIAQVNQDGFLTPMHTDLVPRGKLVITFDELLRRTAFASHMRTMLNLLEQHYHSPVDTEFTLRIVNPEALHPEVRISLLQCRPQSRLRESDVTRLPSEFPEEDVIFSTRRMAPQGVVPVVRYVLFVPPEGYFNLSTQTERNKLERAIGCLNEALEGQTFISVGPGRWGTSTPDQGVHIGYADIYNTSALVEISGEGIGSAPEPSFGTHFFQDLMEAQIFPIAICMDDKGVVFNRSFFYETPNRLSEWISVDEALFKSLRLIAVEDFRAGHHLTLIMNDDQNQAVAFLQKDQDPAS